MSVSRIRFGARGKSRSRLKTTGRLRFTSARFLRRVSTAKALPWRD
jgi:hypothetical protein